MSVDQKKNIVETCLDYAEEHTIDVKYINLTPIVIARNDIKIIELQHLRDNPIHAEQTTKHTTAESFINYYNEYCSENSAIFINELDASFIAIFDFHSKTDAGWKKHVSTFELSVTPEWSEWKNNNKKKMTQEQFGQFIENNQIDIIQPASADMLEIALSMQAKTEIKYSSAIRLDSGQTQLVYNEVIDGTAGTKGQLKIPEMFTIGLKLFRGNLFYKLGARLRYRINEGNLTIWYELIRPHLTVDANINDTIELIQQMIKVDKIYHGVSS